MDSTPSARLMRARVSLEGLADREAFGERFFVHPNVVHLLIDDRALPAPIWKYTDDTQMALSIVAVLGRHGTLDQDRLAKSFGTHYDISRGYGPAMHRLLPAIRSRIHWSKAARELFGGQGSYGNGAAMRVSPLGAYFADDLDALVGAAVRSAEVTPTPKASRAPWLLRLPLRGPADCATSTVRSRPRIISTGWCRSRLRAMSACGSRRRATCARRSPSCTRRRR